MFSSAKWDKIEECKSNNGGRLPEEGEIVVIKGTKKGEDACYIDKLGIQSAKIYMNLRDLKEEENILE